MFEGRPVSPLSHILHLADRIAVQISRREPIISQIEGICSRIRSQSGAVFRPELVDAFLEIGGKESLWLDLTYQPLFPELSDLLALDALRLDLDELVDLSGIFSRIIDFRSPFTARHSAGVAGTAEKLAELAGFSEDERKMMRVAGYLHDLGKLAVRKEVLEKPGRLDPAEFDIIRSHTFYTFRLLEPVRGFEEICQWAAFHHEKLNGTGYPFHLQGSSLSLGSRIMAVADIFAAITEDRPYRRGMSDRETAAVLRQMAEDGSICPQVVSLLMDHFESVSRIRREAEERAAAAYSSALRPAKRKQ